ncbi:DUF6207 family protein [Streptomyces sp. NPDC056580]|uniref:DUF6207 family protein n=1 Tax=Streptomyces sp. NPDC056580 TaxID=3345872 RepID=UPI0036C01BED
MAPPTTRPSSPSSKRSRRCGRPPRSSAARNAGQPGVRLRCCPGTRQAPDRRRWPGRLLTSGRGSR